MLRLRPFEYFEPETLSEAIQILAEKGYDARPLAGGTDILVRMKRDQIAPRALVNLMWVQGLNQIREEKGKRITIGALTSISTLESSPLIRCGHPVLAQAAGMLGSPSIRNLGTLGGNVGRASPASDMVPSLIVLSARVIVEGKEGPRDMALESLFQRPGQTTLRPGELITGFCVPKMPSRSGAAYVKLGRRQGVTLALAGAAVFLGLGEDAKRVVEARVALASVAPVPLRSKRAEEELLSGTLTEKRMRKASMLAAEDSSPITDIRASAAYRKELVKVLTHRALEQALQFAQRGESH